MAQCETCGNEYERSIQVVANGVAHFFDCFECAVEALAPRCANCGVKIMGHGLQAGGTYYCCNSCAQKKGVKGLCDHA